jgi:membrane fusion protein (multidrug efflux system)
MKRRLLVFSLLICALLLSGCGSNKADPKEVKEEKAIAVEVVRAMKGDISSFIHTTGTVYPKQEAFLSPKIGGKIEKIFVDEGDRVTQGQPLVRLEQTKLIMEKTEAEANYNTVKSELKKAELNLENLTRTMKRNEELYKQGIIDAQKYDDTKNDYLNAEAHLQVSSSRLEEAKAQLDQANQDLKDSVVYAPFSGFIVDKMMNEGEMVYAAAPSKVLHLTDISRVKIECGIAEVDKKYLLEGKEVIIEVDAFPGERFKGEITTVNPFIDQNSRTFMIKIEIPNPNCKLESGMFARIKIQKEGKKEAIMVPLRSVIEREGKKVVFVADNNNRARMVPVVLGINDTKTTEVVSGLKGGELIVNEGFYALSDGAKINFSPPKSP